jgi:hypothetical protein
MGDRGDEDRFGRMILRRYQAVKRNLGANLTAMNISSALSQLIPVPQILAATSKTSFLKAVADTMTSLKKDDGLGYLSDFLQRREGFDRIYKDPIQRFRDATGVPFKVIDRFTSQLALRSFYYDALKKGMNKEDAIKKADEMAGKLMAERTAGTQPVWFDSKGLFSTLTQFQLEVNNQFRFMFKDIPKEGKAKLIGFLIQMFMYDLGFNYLWEKMTGRKPAFDPIGMVLDTGRDIDNPNLNTGTKVWNGVQRVADQLPFTSTLTGGRIPLLNSLPDVQGLVKGETKIGDELWNVANLAWPFGGAGQVKKTVQGLNAYSKGKETTPAGNLRYPIEKNLPNLARGALFGKSSFPEAVDYWNMGRGPMSKAQTEEYMKAENKGKGGKDTYLGIERKTLQNQLATLKKDTKIKGEEKRKKLETLQKKLDLNMRSR